MTNSTPLRAILFDLDGVLVDSRGPITSCINHALACEGLESAPPDELQRFIGPPLHDTFVTLLAERGVSVDRAEACVEHYRERYRVIAPLETPAFEGIEGCLEALAERHPCAVATSKPEAFARPILERLGLARHFAAIVGPPLVRSHAETKTGTVGRAIRTVGDLPPASIAMIGDTHFDMAAGRAHGLHTIGVSWGIGSEQELTDAGAHELVDTPDALRAALLTRG